MILVDGALAVWLEPKGKHIATATGVPAESIELALAVGLPRGAARQRRRELLVETIDGEAAASSSWSRGLLAAGARIDYRGLVVTGQLTTVAPPPEPEPEVGDEPDDEDGQA